MHNQNRLQLRLTPSETNQLYGKMGSNISKPKGLPAWLNEEMPNDQKQNFHGLSLMKGILYHFVTLLWISDLCKSFFFRYPKLMIKGSPYCGGGTPKEERFSSTFGLGTDLFFLDVADGTWRQKASHFNGDSLGPWPVIMLLKFNPEFAFELTLSLAQVDTLSWTADMVAVFLKKVLKWRVCHIVFGKMLYSLELPCTSFRTWQDFMI